MFSSQLLFVGCIFDSSLSIGFVAGIEPGEKPPENLKGILRFAEEGDHSCGRVTILCKPRVDPSGLLEIS